MEQTRFIENKQTKSFVVAGMMLGMFIAAMDQTVVSTAIGTIVSDLGGLDQFIWVTSAYLVAEMAGMPIFGKLSDMYGRKRFFIFGLSMFLFGSILCGTAESITQLSLYRALQGIGGGSLMPIAFAIVFDIFPPEDRGKMSGLFGAVFGLSSVLGPLLGAFITDHFSWHWIFYINVPLGLVAVILIIFFYKESGVHKRQIIDWSGAATLVLSIVCLMFAIELGGKSYAWTSPVILGLFAGFVLFFTLFLAAETRASDPIISFRMFQKRLFASSNLIGLIYGIPFMVAVVFMPVFIQGVFGGTATNAGLMLIPMMVGVTLASMVAGLLAQFMSYRSIMLIHGTILAAGLLLAGIMTAETPFSFVIIYMVIIGFGVGASFSVLGMAVIHEFKPEQYGTVNATLSFLRELGMTVGITIFGSIQSHLMTAKLKEAFSEAVQNGFAGHLPDARAALSPETRQHIPEAVLGKMTDAISASITQTLLWALIPAGLALLFMFFMPGYRLQTGKKRD
ncbi:DHA2 family efflux MFS transporter permease subunit [Sporolactobacillus sp. THM7-7]|nr:DHA2 family efflux MFS transporter permease subunit [Sporolactobacillus sp. THM7-7]